MSLKNIVTTPLKLGASAPFKLLHISDTHLAFADERDDERKRKLAEGRYRSFAHAEEYFADELALAKKENALLCHTGDLIDFVSAANLDRAKKFADENDCFFVAGNHEFSLYVGEAFEDEAYREQSLAKVQACFRNDIRFSSRIVNGVNLVGIDDGYYRFDRPQLDALKQEAGRGLPILLFMHNPLYEQKLFEHCMTRASSAYLTAAPDELITGYDDYRYRQQKADDLTKEAFACIRSEPLIKAVFTGHLHYDWEGMVTDTLPQYVTGIGTARLITVE